MVPRIGGRPLPAGGVTGMPVTPCRVWAFRNDCELEASELALLDAEERAQAARLKAKIDRDAFIKTRAALRSLLGRETGIPPRDIAFRYSTWGKPSIEAQGQPSADFSVSHTRGLSVVALARNASVGVDVEPYRACPDRIRIAADVFGLDVAQQLLALKRERQDAVFLGLWTAGEAFVKARGVGFAGMNGTKVPVCLSDRTPELVVLREDSQDDWSLTPLDLGNDFVGHVVVGTRAGRAVRPNPVELRVAAGVGSR
jgi:4'-phosphopantetheinyl transferase